MTDSAEHEQVDAADPTGGDLGTPTQTEKDRSYSPSSGRETELRQEEDPSGISGTAPEGDADSTRIHSRPGAGGPDDAGDVDVDDEAIRRRIAEREVDPGDRPVG